MTVGGGRRLVALLLAVALAGVAGCSSPSSTAGSAGAGRPSAIGPEPGPVNGGPSPPSPSPPPPVPGSSPATVVIPPPTSATTVAPGTVVEVAYRIERRTADAATAGYEATVEATLADPRGWRGAGFRLVRSPSATFVVVLAEGPQVDALCLPYDTYGLYSCQNGPVVALNADRWRTATPKWTGTIEDYRRYLVGHEVGHLLGLHHPTVQCPVRGRPAALMSQQSTELNGCIPNPWPRPDELSDGRRRPADLAPPYRPDVRPG